MKFLSRTRGRVMANLRKTLAACALAALLPGVGQAVEIADYTAFPPFLPRVVSPNILFVLDYSKSMVRPAYGVCDTGQGNCRTTFVQSSDDYDGSQSYPGYFDSAARYSCTTGNSGSCTKNPAGAWSGNWLNWLTMTQFDVLKKVVVGGDITASPEQGNPSKLRSILTGGIAIRKTADLDKCTGSSPGCTQWPALAYRNDTWAGGTDIAKEVNKFPNDPATMVYNKLYKTSTWDAGDEGIAKVQLPFPFNFYGTNYTDLFVHSNGLLGFTFSALARDTYTFVASTVIPQADANNLNNLIAPYFRDLALGNDSKIKISTIGASPDRIFAVTYENVYHYPASSYVGNGGITFQVLFHERSNHIVFQYKDLTLTTSSGGSLQTGNGAVVGVENADGSKGKQYSAFAAAGLSESLAVFASGHVTYLVTPDGSKPTNFNAMAPLPGSGDIYSVNVDIATVAKVGGLCPSGSWLNKYRDTCYNHQTEGLLQEFRDGELAGLLGFRLGIMEIDNGQLNGGKVVKHFNEKDTTGWSSLMSATRGRAPSTEAPIAEALYEAQGYFRQNTAYMLRNGDWTNHGTGATCASTGNNYDPFCFQSAAQRVPCVKSYVLMVSSGNYSHDNTTNIYGDPANAESWSNTWSLGWRSTGEASGQEGSKANGGWLDNVAYQMRLPATTPDLRSDLPGDQIVTLYAVNTFGAGSGDGTAVLKRATKYGGFRDANGNGQYDAGEDDRDNDGFPDTYFEASGGSDLRAKIVAAVLDILKNSASGTSVSVLSTSAGGEGALYQAYFYPARIDDLNVQQERRWPGFLRSFFIDRYQNLRDDYSGGAAEPDKALVFGEDRVARMFLDTSDNSVKVKLYNDSNADGKLTGSEETPVGDPIAMDNIVSLWEAGSLLAQRTKSERNIYLWVDADGNGLINSGEGDFNSLSGKTETFKLSTGLASTLKSYLRAKATTGTDAFGNPITLTTADQEAENIVDFVLGNHVQSYSQEFRNRCVSVGQTQTGCASGQSVWPLGDIVFSTPTLVTAPAERYDMIYKDAGYKAFRDLYRSRRAVVYVGANDGLLHAFNAGVYKEGDKASTSGKTEYGWFEANPASNGWGLSASSPKLGDELWAFLPHDNLPHLAWLACAGTTTDPSACGDSEYTHVYYVDHRPKVSDVRIFNDAASGVSDLLDGQDVSHPQGWGTVLIMPMRLGGGAMNVDFNGDGDTNDAGEQSFRSAYYAFDVTDPEKPPRLLWRWTHASLGFSTSYPAIARVKTDSDEKWFMVVGSGPDNQPPGVGSRAYGFADSTQDGRVFFVDLTNPAAAVAHDIDSVITTRQVLGDATVIDVDRDFSSDVIYIGAAVNPTGNQLEPSYGRIYRINIRKDPNPNNWLISRLFDPNTSNGGPPSGAAADPDSDLEMGPVLVSPSAAMDKAGNLWIYFGTGLLRNTGDLTNSDQQRFYGIKDRCWKDASASACMATEPNGDNRSAADSHAYKLTDLMNTSDVKVYEISPTRPASQQVSIPSSRAGAESPCGGDSSTTSCYYTTFYNRVTAKKGWYKDLKNPTDPSPSERVLARSSVLGGVVLFTTYTPSGDLCSVFGDSYLYALFYETGAAYNKPIIGSFRENSSTGNPIMGADGREADAPEGNPASGEEHVIREKDLLGPGMPTSVGMAVGETTSGFIQKSTGEIKQIETEPAYKLKSGPQSWREESTGGGTVGVESIYKHIVK